MTCSNMELETAIQKADDGEFLRELTSRGLSGVQLLVADDHQGLKGAADKVLGAPTQRCRVHFRFAALRVGATCAPGCPRLRSGWWRR